jgi:choline transport protein
MSKTDGPEPLRFAEGPVDADDSLKASHVPVKYQGTAADRQDMNMLGKKQVLRRQFRFSTMLGFASTVMVAWEFVLLVSPFGLSDGGTAGVFWGLIICPFAMTPIYASLAEVASMSPTSAGQYRKFCITAHTAHSALT